MKVSGKLLRSTLAVMLLLLITMPMRSQTARSHTTSVLLELAHSYCAADCDSVTTRIYSDGRYTSEGTLQEKAKSGRPRKVSFKWEKQLEAEELAALVTLAERPDFLNAQPEYEVKTVVDYPDWLTITYRNKGREKTVKIINYSRGNEAERSRVPSTMLQLEKLIQPYTP